MKTLKLTLIAIAIFCATDLSSGAQDFDISSLPAETRAILMRNAVGTKAMDFTYVTQNGALHEMKDFKANYTLLYFFDPECYTCVATIDFLSEKPEIAPLLESGKLKVLAINTNTSSTDVWYLNFPKGWTLGSDTSGDIRDKMLYLMNSSPAMFLLDKKKTVLIKDATVEQLQTFEFK